MIELFVVVVIFAIIVGAVMVSLSMSRSAYLSTDAYVQVQQELRRAFDQVVRELREAGGTITVVGGNQIDFQMALGYNLAAPCPANAVCWGVKDQAGVNQPNWRVRYQLNGVQLIREILNAAGVVQAGTRVLANDVGFASFAYDGPTRVVTVQLRVQQSSLQLPGGSMSTGATPLMTRIRLRN